ncbi:MAG: putative inorganic carbon transporter subunit DabA, partial [Polyangiaceae bacterium]
MTSTSPGADTRSAPAIAPTDVDVDRLLRQVAARIAPTWPLDRFIAVNPFWELVGEPLPELSARLSALSGARLLMPRSWFLNEWRSGRVGTEHLEEAIARSGARASVADLRELLETDEPATTRRARVMDVADLQRDLSREMSWRDFVTHSSSQFCAAFFDEGRGKLGPSREGGLYASWRRQAIHDRSPSLLMGLREYSAIARELPAAGREMARLALGELSIAPPEREPYLHGLLLDLNGWASWCAYQRWTARLAGKDQDPVVDLIAVRLAWEWILWRAGGRGLAFSWKKAMDAWPSLDAAARASRVHDWLFQSAIEIAWQRPVCEGLRAGVGADASRPRAAVQAVFCIDVRSEVFRRALEAQSPTVQTLGFAGFFGMPIEYRPAGAATARPQLPGLLAPRLRATDSGVSDDRAAARAARLDSEALWTRFKTGALSGFAFVEAMGLSFAGALLADSLGRGRQRDAGHAGLSSSECVARKPRLAADTAGRPLDVPARAALAAGMLRAMSLTRNFARLVALVGHGSEASNNPHAAALDCGACCGQTGEVNARAAAALLNEPGVRAALTGLGIDVGATTRFVAGLHNTTTDEVTLFDLDEIPPSHADDLARLQRWLCAASVIARKERADNLGLGALDASSLRRAVAARAVDWAQVRPEWGLANNAAFIVAPREHCRH